MRRFLLQFVSIPAALVVGAFAYVGGHTFAGNEKQFATAVLYYCMLLLVIALLNFFGEQLFWFHLVLAVGLLGVVVGVQIYAGATPP